MNPGQKLFYDFIMERAKDEKKAEAKALLGEGFSRQAAGTFDKGYFSGDSTKDFGSNKA